LFINRNNKQQNAAKSLIYIDIVISGRFQVILGYFR